jgi:hypothetical protein
MKHKVSKCSCTNKKETKQVNGLEVLTPYPKKRNGFERKLNRYNHIMEFVRTILAFTTLGLQLIILYRLFN